MKKRLMTVDLCLFDGEGGSAAAGAGTGDTAAPGATQIPSAAGKGRRANNPLADVVYGKQETQGAPEGQQAAAAGETNISDTLEARKAEFDRMIKGDYADIYQEYTQDIAKNRVKNAKALSETIEKQTPIMSLLAQKYGVKDASDIDGIMKALEADSSFFEEAAAKEGLTVEQYKRMQQLERENAQLKATKETAERQRQADQVYAGWMQEAEQLKGTYPGFDLQTELKSQQFQKMLGAGVGLKAAFEALHHDEIMAGAMQHTARTISKKIADGVASRQNRPVENGLSSQASANVKSDVSKLTRADRAEIARRVARGERISF